MPFEFSRLGLEGLVLIKPLVFSDERGHFMETFRYTDFKQAGIEEKFVQENQSYSLQNVLRGLHFQNPPFAQGKLVRCVLGEIYDVAVDIRKKSPDYGKWEGISLTGDNNLMVYIPPGFAHGFLTLSKEALVSYKTTEIYSPDHEAGIIWNDPDIGIDWRLSSEPILSRKDAELPVLKEAYNNF